MNLFDLNPDSDEELCLALLRADTEGEVIRVLDAAGYWHDLNAWVPYGGVENSYAQANSQHSTPEGALVEKITNSIDAVLTRECRIRGIDPESDEAPRSIRASTSQFFGVRNGRLTDTSPERRAQLAAAIELVATGSNRSPSYTIVDAGEGQEPERFAATLLSQNASNKAKIHFVHGAHNMGGSGALVYCSENHKLQLVISRRDPLLSPSSRWGFTVIRRLRPTTGEYKSSRFVYLAPGGRILQFQSASIPARSGPPPHAYREPLEHGTVIKLYEYALSKTLRTNALFDLHNRLALLLPELAYPVRICERRSGYKGHTLDTTLAGLIVRLNEERGAASLEPGFPTSHQVRIAGERMTVHTYAFRRGAQDNFVKREGVLFTINGQANATLDRSFFGRKEVGMSYLEPSLLVVVDCSELSWDKREDLLMSSRDRLRGGGFADDIVAELGNMIRDHEGLRQLRERRRQEEVTSRIGDDKPIAEVLTKAMRRSRVLRQLLVSGERISDPFALRPVGSAPEYVGKRFPTFFSARKHPDPKPCACNRRFRIDFETDADNEYFSRADDCGTATLWIVGVDVSPDFTLNLWNGHAHTNVSLPSSPDLPIGAELHYRLEITDPTQVEPFAHDWTVVVGPLADDPSGIRGPARPPRGSDGSKNLGPAGLALPEVIPVLRDDWAKHNMSKLTAVRIVHDPNTGYIFYVNMDNQYLLSEIKERTRCEPDFVRLQFRVGVALLALAIVQEVDVADTSQGERVVSNYDQASLIVDRLAPILIPLLDSVTDLDV